MENNKNVLRYVACACFGICLLIELSDFIGCLRDAIRYSYPFYQFMNLAFAIAAFALIIAAIITSKQMLLVAGGVFGVLGTFIDSIYWLRNAYYYIDYFPGRMFREVIVLATWAVFILIGLMGKQYGKILGIIGGALMVISRITIVVLNKLAYGGSHYSFQFYLYAIGFIGGVVLLGLTADSFPSAGSAAFGASGQYGAGAPRQYRQYRRYDASAPGGGPGPQNYQMPGGGPAPYNYQGPGGAGQQNYQAPGGGPAPYNYQGPGGAGQQNYQAPGGGTGPQNYQAPGGGPAPYNYQGPGGAGQQNYQAPGGGPAPYNYQGPGGGWEPQNYQAPGGGAPQNYQAPGGGEAPQNDSAPDGGSAPNDNSAQDSVSPFFYNPGKSDEDAPL